MSRSTAPTPKFTVKVCVAPGGCQSASLGDLQGASDRLRAGQRQARGGSGAAATPVDFIDVSVIDARLRDVEALRKQLLADSRDPKPF